ncbi:sigma-54-dependent transcriptional regulator [Paracoccus tegillarcae]|uniref:Sigma-54-dependent Fis family transcriptional regulator n=1 Tax=Paracoccus tegillarcae TaxID=1529068 RepID=A0A2K9EGD2_9RHOB|nr:sigma-54 dependent transcriptional regulator [Paracoccus tegillarcae]AUH34030.1 sigma-54-dependent Fis family transcriptional regulator [Paracoccus tegillarcae]
MNNQPKIYVVDDDADLLSAMVEIIEAAGMPVRGFSRGRAMLAELDPEWDGVILSDIRMPEMSGLELLAHSRTMAPGVPFLLITAHGDVRSAVQAIQSGAFDFIEKPAPPEYLLAVIRRALETRRLLLENRRLKERIARGTDLRARLLGRSVAMRNCRRELAAVAPLDIDVLLYGEPGTGKQLAARALHDFSGLNGDFVQVDAATLTEANFAAVMLGQGDDAPVTTPMPHGGTLYLERVNALIPPLQNRLLALMEARRSDARFRVIASAHGSIEQLRQTDAMSDDLYYRLSLAEVELPPLRERESDIYLLLAQFLREAAQRHDRRFPELTQQDLRPYRSYHWPGNLRELRNVAEKLVIGLKVTLQPAAPTAIGARLADDLSYDDAMRDFESSLLRAALQKTGGRKAEAATVLGVPRKRLYLRMKACGLLPAGQD